MRIGIMGALLLLLAGCAPELAFYNAERRTHEVLGPFVVEQAKEEVAEINSAAAGRELTRDERKRLLLMEDHQRHVRLWGDALDDWKEALGE